MSKLFNSDDDDFGYLDDSIHINAITAAATIMIAGSNFFQLI